MANDDFAYRVRRYVRIDDLQLDETEHHSCDASLPRHFHERGLIALPVRGVVVSDDRRGRVRLVPGNAAFLPAGETHSVSFPEGAARVFSIEIGPRWLGATLGHDADQLVDRLMRLDEAWLAGAVARLYRRFASRTAADFAVEEQLLDLFARRRERTASIRRSPPAWLRRAREVVADNPRAPWKFGQLAAAVGVHPVTLSRAFTESYGVTLSVFLRRRRLDWARSALVASDLHLGAIALASGFANHAHFSRTFRHVVGMTPTAFRAAFRPVESRSVRESRHCDPTRAQTTRTYAASESGIFAV